jgi:hypothetical protein
MLLGLLGVHVALRVLLVPALAPPASLSGWLGLGTCWGQPFQLIQLPERECHLIQLLPERWTHYIMSSCRAHTVVR